MRSQFQQQFDVLPDYLGSHLEITAIALGVGLAISLPLAILVAKWRPGRWPVLSTASIIQTIPSLALLALMVPLLGKINPQIALGFWPAIIALTCYSILPILRNTVTGILGVDPDMTEAARGLGMTPAQVLTRVELPLAAPIIIAGVRTATVWVIGIATLSTPVGQESLGNYIFSGLQLRNWTMVLFGCVAAAILAIILDSLIALLETATERRSRLLGGLGVAGLVVVLVGGLNGPAIVHALNSGESGGGRAADQRSAAHQARTHRVIQIAIKNFTEQYILGAMLQDRLQQAGFRTHRRGDLGSTFAFNGLINNKFDVYVDYTGTIWANIMKREQTPSAKKVLYVMTGWLDGKYGVRCLGSLGFENAYTLAMRSKETHRLGIRTIGDLSRYAPKMSFGSDHEFLGRPEWTAIRDAYHLRFARKATYSPTFMYQAIHGGKVDVIPAFSTDGRIAAFHLKVLDDPKHAFPPYQAVLLLSRRASKNKHLVNALKPLVGAISDKRMRHANQLVDIKGQTPEQAARALERAVLP